VWEAMTMKERNRRFLTDLFCGEFRGHRVICVPPLVSAVQAGDYAVSREPVKKQACEQLSRGGVKRWQ